MAYIGSSPTKVVSRQSANIFTYTATANQTAFTGSDANGNTLACTPSDIMVHMNGLRLEESDFTATTTTVTLGSGAAVGDEVTITAFVTFETADAYTKSASDTRYVNTAGDTMTGDLQSTELVANNAGNNTNIRVQNTASGSGSSDGFLIQNATNSKVYLWNYENADVLFGTNGAERMRIDSSGNLLVGKTATGIATVGAELKPTGELLATVSGDACAFLNRKTSDGTIIDLRKDGSTAGYIGTGNGGDLYIGNSGTGLMFAGGSNAIIPTNQTALRDNAIDLGHPNYRFDDVYATNGSINTSDENEKQNIESLTSAEITAAKAISKLFKTYKWKDKVAAKGDDARTHTGVIAQQVQTAMTDSGLDASKYAFWCSDTWTNDDGNEQTRMGVRYPELLAFVGAATEQRLTNIETRLAALEGG